MESPADPALSELLSRMHWVRGLARALVQDVDRADDLSQEAWSRALRGGPVRAEAWRGWFARVMKNRVADEKRDAGKQARFESRQPREDRSISQEEMSQQMETHQALSEAMRALPDPYRRAVFLHYFEGWSLARIAAEDGCNKRAIEKRLRQARAMLRTHLERRAPAEHWAAGLLLLAGPASKTGQLIAAGILTAIALIAPTAWILRSESSATQAETRAALGQDLPVVESAVEREAAQLPSIPLEPIGLERSVVETGILNFEMVIHVVDKETNAAVVKARVMVDCLDEVGRLLESGRGVSDSQGLLSLSFTSRSTQAEITVLPEGKGYQPESRVSHSWYLFTERRELIVSVAPLEGAVRGTVLDEAGLPVSGAFVDIWIDGDELNSPHPDYFVQADQDGRFEVDPARLEGCYLTMTPRSEGMSAKCAFKVERSVPAGTAVDGVELILGRGRSFMVEVVNERRQPISGAHVTVWPTHGKSDFAKRGDGTYEGARSFALSTDSRGRTREVMIGCEQWQVGVQHPAFRKQETGELIPDDAHMVVVVLAEGRTIRGVLKDKEGLPVPNVPVLVQGTSDTEEVRTDAQGTFIAQAPGLAGEEVRILCIPSRIFAFHVTGPLVPEDLDGPLSIILQHGLQLNVELIFADGSPFDRLEGLEWDVLNGPTARALGGDAGTARSWLKWRPVDERDAFPDAGFRTNHFYFSQCPPGTYRIRFNNPDGILAEADVIAGMKGQTVVIGGAPAAHGVFHGQVEHAITGLALQRFDVSGRRYAGQDREAKVLGQLGETVQDLAGGFRFENLISGWWEFEIEESQELTEWRSNRIWIEAEGDPWRVKLDEVLAGELTILLPDGTPAARCNVMIADEHNDLLLFARGPGTASKLRDQTDDAGRIRLARLPRTLPFQILVSPQNSPTRVIPAGALDPQLTEWRITLPE